MRINKTGRKPTVSKGKPRPVGEIIQDYLNFMQERGRMEVTTYPATTREARAQGFTAVEIKKPGKRFVYRKPSLRK